MNSSTPRTFLLWIAVLIFIPFMFVNRCHHNSYNRRANALEAQVAQCNKKVQNVEDKYKNMISRNSMISIANEELKCELFEAKYLRTVSNRTRIIDYFEMDGKYYLYRISHLTADYEIKMQFIFHDAWKRPIYYASHFFDTNYGGAFAIQVHYPSPWGHMENLIWSADPSFAPGYGPDLERALVIEAYQTLSNCLKGKRKDL